MLFKPSLASLYPLALPFLIPIPREEQLVGERWNGRWLGAPVNVYEKYKA